MGSSRAAWVGEIVVGLLPIPVSLYSATSGETDLKFNEFVKAANPAKDGFELHPVGRLSVDKVAKEAGNLVEVLPSEVVKGYVIGEDIVEITDDELKSLAPVKSKSLIVETFVPAAALRPEDFTGRHFHVKPGRKADDAASVLFSAMLTRRVAAIGRMVVRGKEYLAAVRVVGSGLMVGYLNFASEKIDPGDYVITDPEEFNGGPEFSAALALVEKMSGAWLPGLYESSHTARVLKFIHAKHKGEDVETPEAPDIAEPTGSLLDLLERSIQTGV